jgi:hypothetical protein
MLQLFSRHQARIAPEELKAGDRYCRMLGSKYLETATVLELRPDLVGIPHVRYSVVVEHPDFARVDMEGTRTLALSRFVDEFQREVAE